MLPKQSFTAQINGWQLTVTTLSTDCVWMSEFIWYWNIDKSFIWCVSPSMADFFFYIKQNITKKTQTSQCYSRFTDLSVFNLFLSFFFFSSWLQSDHLDTCRYFVVQLYFFSELDGLAWRLFPLQYRFLVRVIHFAQVVSCKCQWWKKTFVR